MQKRLTPAQIWLVHSLEVLAMGSVFTVVATLYGAFQSGNFNIAQIGVTVAGILGAFLAKGFSGLLTNPQTIQAGEETLGELRSGIAQLMGSHQTLLSMLNAFLQQQPQPPVTVHVTSPTPATATLSQASIEAQPTQSVPVVPPAPQAAPIAPPFSLPTFSSAMPAMPRQ